MNKAGRSNLKIFLIAFTTLYLSINLSAQQQPEREGPPKPPGAAEVYKMVDDLSITLSLSESQKKEVSDLFINHFNEIRASLENKQEKLSRENMESNRKDFEEQVKKLLNDEQKVEFDKFMKNHRPQHNQQTPKR